MRVSRVVDQGRNVRFARTRPRAVDARGGGRGAPVRRAFASAPAPAGGERVHEFALADIGEGISEVELLEWHVAPGEPVEQFQAVCTVQSDKASVEITSRHDGRPTLRHDVGDMVDVGAVLVDIVADGGGGAAPAAAPAAAAAPAPAAAPAAPLALASAATPWRGASPGRRASTSRPSPGRAPGPRAQGRRARGGRADRRRRVRPDERRDAAPPRRARRAAGGGAGAGAAPIRGVRRLMFDSMAASLAVPHFVYADEFDAGRCVALHRFPEVNASIVEDAGGRPALEVHESHDVGLAMDTPQGLVVPAVRDVGNKSIGDVAAELARLRDAARAGGLAPGDVAPTLTLNIGAIGGTYMSPPWRRPSQGKRAHGRGGGGLGVAVGEPRSAARRAARPMDRRDWPLHGPTCAFVDAAARSAVAAASADAAAAALARDVAGGGSPTTPLTPLFAARTPARCRRGGGARPRRPRRSAPRATAPSRGSGPRRRRGLLLGGDDSRHAGGGAGPSGLGLPTPDYAAEVLAGADAAAYGALRAAELGDATPPRPRAAALFVPLLVAAACRRAPGPGRAAAARARARSRRRAPRATVLALWATPASARPAATRRAAAALARAAAAREAPRPAAEPRRRGLRPAAALPAARRGRRLEVAGREPGDAAALRGRRAGDYFAACATADRAAVAVAAVEHALDFCRDALGDGAGAKASRAPRCRAPRRWPGRRGAAPGAPP
ncbi:dihydrolipoamide acetyltransferase [Aureococcus anophagefferens]|nr:dihydrolipoamide acetyltransferase [Aureococcus anophagefferens]